jgi:hypothetical protein
VRRRAFVAQAATSACVFASAWAAARSASVTAFTCV